MLFQNEQGHIFSTIFRMRPAKTEINMSSAQSDQSLCCASKDALNPSLLTECPETTDQTARIRRLIGVFAGCIFIGRAYQ